MEISSYSSIFHWKHKNLRPLLELEDLLVEEKVDGSQFSFGVLNGELRVRSKGATFPADAPNKMFNKGVETARSLFETERLREGWVYRGEYLMKPKHNILKYDRNPEGFVIIFDIQDKDGEFLSPEAKAYEAQSLGLQCVPLLHRGKVNEEILTSLLGRESILGGVPIEGVVIKPASYNLYGMDKKILMGKLVSQEFKEKHAMEWGANNPSRGDILTRIGKALRHETRWEKQIQHLKENGTYTNSPQDIGPLIRSLKEDLKKEEYDNVAQALVKEFWDDIERFAMRGFPEWFKAKLGLMEFNDPDLTPSWRLMKPDTSERSEE